MLSEDIANRFKFHPATTPERGAEHDAVRNRCGGLAAWLNEVLPEGREKALAVTHLEETMMWANAAIARQS
jgi:hypothetical protein